MKKLLLILLYLPMIGFGQTLIPDANFEQALIDLGYDTGIPDGVISTSSINTVTVLSISNLNISNLIGIEDFTSLTHLHCSNNQLSTLNLSNNTSLIYLHCSNNQLTSLDVSQCLDLEQLRCDMNALTSLDLSQHLNFSDELYLSNNNLTSLNIKNGNNYMIVNNQFSIEFNPNLTCIEVDDPAYSATNWLNIDSQHYFSNSCSGTEIQEHSSNKGLIKIIDILGKEINNNEDLQLHIYDDGTVKKKYLIK